MIKELVKPEVVEIQDEKVVPFAEKAQAVATCSCDHHTSIYTEEEIDDITF
jgi:hypothetical protein